MSIRRMVLIAIGSSAALVVAVLVWRLDPVQEFLRPQKFFTNQVLLIELDIDYLRNRLAECATGGYKAHNSAVNEAVKPLSEPGGRVETVNKLCNSYDEDLKTAVDALLEAKKKLKDARS